MKRKLTNQELIEIWKEESISDYCVFLYVVICPFLISILFYLKIWVGVIALLVPFTIYWLGLLLTPNRENRYKELKRIIEDSK